MTDAELEIKRGERFTFGENWRRFLFHLDEGKIIGAEAALKELLGVETLQGLRFLDMGSGSGLSSLVARRLGAKVISFDYDPQSVACTEQLRSKYFPDDEQWTVMSGSALDAEFLKTLGQFDVVYSWGVLHHTGDMWTAMKNAFIPMSPGGKLSIAIYNDQGWVSRYWHGVKSLYNQNAFLQALMIVFHVPYLTGARWLVRLATGRLNLERGMTIWYDTLDWLGGLPFEVASRQAVEDFCYQQEGYVLTRYNPGARHGCNEFVFVHKKNDDLGEGA